MNHHQQKQSFEDVSPIKNGVLFIASHASIQEFLTNGGGEAAVPWNIPIDTWTQVAGITRTIAAGWRNGANQMLHVGNTHRINVWHISTY